MINLDLSVNIKMPREKSSRGMLFCNYPHYDFQFFICKEIAMQLFIVFFERLILCPEIFKSNQSCIKLRTAAHTHCHEKCIYKA